MMNTHKLELPLTRTYFYGSNGVRAIEVLLYFSNMQVMLSVVSAGLARATN